MYSKKPSLNRPTMGLTLHGPFREVVSKGVRISLQWYFMGECLGTQIKQSIYRGVVNLWRWLVREVLLYLITYLFIKSVIYKISINLDSGEAKISRRPDKMQQCTKAIRGSWCQSCIMWYRTRNYKEHHLKQCAINTM